MQARRRELFTTIRTEGAILPPDLLQRVAAGDPDLGGLKPGDYHLFEGEPLNEAIVRSWNRLVGAWAAFTEARDKLPEGDLGTTVTRERWLLILFEALGYGRLQSARAVEIEGKSYAVSHAWGERVPIHLVGSGVPLGQRSQAVAGAASMSPHGLVQELLNRSDERLWAFVSNGLTLRVLRDNSSLTRQAYVEFDLASMMDGDVYADFVVLWLVCHESRVEGDVPHECWLEHWSQEAVKQGTRALDGLRAGVEAAISGLGGGFLSHPANADLRDALRAGTLDKQEYYRELLRLVYRLLFLFVAEDRGLLLDPKATREAADRYERFYSTQRLRRLGERRRGSKHSDLYDGLRLVMEKLGDDNGCSPLGLAGLGSYLWSAEAAPHLGSCELPNAALLDAVRALASLEERGVRRAVDYRNLGAEELGSVYESLLELHPELNVESGTFALATAPGNERKATGSYYTPTSLISCLLDSALDPVLDEAAANGEHALLDLKVCDPACGSGHFLVAAAHRIAKRLASARTGDEEPSPEATRHALRDVVSRCIYGVDVNPMAVELCKVSLWMEALDPGRPLSFLDVHIKCGNSLLGTTGALIAAGVPDDAFKPLEGDDKELAKALRKQNKPEREGQLAFEDAAFDLAGTLKAEVAAIEAIGDEDIESLHSKERLYRSLSESEAYEQAKVAADAWCAAFVQRKEPAAPRITSGVVHRLANAGGAISDEMQREIGRIAQEYALFHWEVEYPQVFARAGSGFDCVLGNPPWERLKLQEREFFAGHEVANSRNAAHRKTLIAALEVEDPPLYGAWMAALRKTEGESLLLRSSGRYPLCGRGDVNTYAVFAELMRALTGDRGRAGCIVPTGIVTDATTQFFFRDLVDSNSLANVYGFENESFVFPAVHHAFRFCLLTTSARAAERPADFVFYARNVGDLADDERHFALTPEDIRLLNPNTRTCPTFRSSRAAELTKAIYRRVPVLDREGDPKGNPWAASFLRMFDMANDSNLFHADYAPGRLPLYEAKMMHQFDHRWASAEDGAGEITDEDRNDPELSVAPRYWVEEDKVALRVPVEWERNWFLGFRSISGAEKVRTMIATVFPRAAVSGKLPLLFTPSTQAAGLLALLDSFAFDYVVRNKVSGTDVAMFIVRQLPVLPPEVFDEPAPWHREAPAGEWFTSRVLELVYTAADLSWFARDCAYDGPAFRWDPERRALLRAEVDAAFFHLYGLLRDDVDYVMDTFWVVRDRDVRAHGEYHTKRLILEIHDELELAIKSGEPYQTRLDPPPADPRAAHSAESESVLVEGTAVRGAQ
jgi:hypothetical protein